VIQLAKRSSTDFLFECDKADAGALTSGLTPYITSFGDLKVDKGTVDSTPFGATAATYLLGVITKYDPIPIGFFYDDAAEPAPNAVFDITKYTHAVTRSFSLTVGGARVYTGELWISAWNVNMNVGDYHKCTATVQFTGTIAVA
jgi:hypothetical protein